MRAFWAGTNVGSTGSRKKTVRHENAVAKGKLKEKGFGDLEIGVGGYGMWDFLVVGWWMETVDGSLSGWCGVSVLVLMAGLNDV